MNKGQGAMVGAIVLAGVLLRPFGTQQPESSSPQRNQPSVSGNEKLPEEGPWIASCRYWAPVREEHLEKASRKLEHQFDLKQDEVELHVKMSVRNSNPEMGCNPTQGARWGFPKDRSRLRVTSIIATVPDPVHTHQSLEFDRIVDGLLSAANDNSYESSYFWLPWHHRGEALRTSEETGEMEPGHDAERERQPGLLILKRVAVQGLDEERNPFKTKPAPPNLYDNYYDVIYVFLVAESPVLGVDGFQLRKALTYGTEVNSELSNKPLQTLFPSATNVNHIIGPIFTGSAASMAAALEADLDSRNDTTRFQLAGTTITGISEELLNGKGGKRVTYYGFQADSHHAKDALLRTIFKAHYHLDELALLAEDNTALGAASSESAFDKGSIIPILTSVGLTVEEAKEEAERRPLTIHFPRELSLLRNAHGETSLGATTSQEGTPSPYLHLSLKDTSTEDGVPHFSRENAPLSQEAQLMAIARQIQKKRIRFALIVSSDPLDQIFLAEFLHRACPDVRMLFDNGDLLMERDVDNIPFVGTLSFSPYPLIGLTTTSRAYPDSFAEAYHNAAVYTFWDMSEKKPSQLKQTDGRLPQPGPGNDKSSQQKPGIDAPSGPVLADYKWPFGKIEGKTIPSSYPPLWITVSGLDGYYPVSIIDQCSSDNAHLLPDVYSDMPAPQQCEQSTDLRKAAAYDPNALRNIPAIHPSLLWEWLCVLAAILCVTHIIGICLAHYWSPLLRDLAVGRNDNPRRRSTYMVIAATVLWCVVFVTAAPALALSLNAKVTPATDVLIWIALATGAFGVLITVVSCRGSVLWTSPSRCNPEERSLLKNKLRWLEGNVYFLTNALTLTAGVAVTMLWWRCCTANHNLNIAGLCFSYRSIYTGNGVAPLVPALLLLLGWYVWAVSQTLRLRFSENNRSELPYRLNDPIQNHYFVSSQDLGGNAPEAATCTRGLEDKDDSGQPEELGSGLTHDGFLFKNITCLMIVRNVMLRYLPQRRRLIGIGLILCFVVLAGLLTIFSPIRSIDRLVRDQADLPAGAYDTLMGGLFWPLLAVAVCGWLRLVLIWRALQHELLERLEGLPIRIAFNRIRPVRWMTLLRQGGIQDRQRHLYRSLESIRRILAHEDSRTLLTETQLAEMQNRLREAERLMMEVQGESHAWRGNGQGFRLIRSVEVEFAWIGTKLLEFLLIPFWRNQQTGYVESEELDHRLAMEMLEETMAHTKRIDEAVDRDEEVRTPKHIAQAEEFLVFRYVALIRGVLANMRYLIGFISASFVLSIIAWNSYPFQPRNELNWLFTALLAVLGGGVMWVLAQMYRDPILSRITETRPNELGMEFYFRIAMFGAVPMVTWIAYQFPDVGGLVFRAIQPALDVVR